MKNLKKGIPSTENYPFILKAYMQRKCLNNLLWNLKYQKAFQDHQMNPKVKVLKTNR